MTDDRPHGILSPADLHALACALHEHGDEAEHDALDLLDEKLE